MNMTKLWWEFIPRVRTSCCKWPVSERRCSSSFGDRSYY